MSDAQRRAELLRALEGMVDAQDRLLPDVDPDAFDRALAEVEAIDARTHQAESAATPASPMPAMRAAASGEPETDTHRGVLARVRRLTAEAGYAPTAVIHGRAIDNPSSWERALEHVISEQDFARIHRQLSAFEGAMVARQRFEERDRERDQARQLPNPMAAVIAEDLAEAERAAEYRRSTEGRLEAVEGVLMEIRDLLRESLQVRRS